MDSFCGHKTKEQICTKINLVIVFFFLLAGMFRLAAQEEAQYLFDHLSDIRISGFGGTMTEFSRVEGEFAVLQGGGGAVIFDQKFFIGGYGMGLATIHRRSDLPEHNNLIISFGHGGLWTGFLFNSHELIHPGVSVHAGGGSIALQDEYMIIQNEMAYDVVFVAMPKLMIEMNVTRWFKLSADVGFRYVAGIDNRKYINKYGIEKRYYRPQDFNSPFVGLSLMFGGFKQ